jgi:hypothetical protein
LRSVVAEEVAEDGDAVAEDEEEDEGGNCEAEEGVFLLLRLFLVLSLFFGLAGRERDGDFEGWSDVGGGGGAERGGECFGHLAGGAEAVFGGEGDGAVDDAEEGFGEVGAEVDEGLSLGAGLGGLGGGEAVEAGGGLAGDEEVEEDADGVDIGADGGGLAAEELGCHVVGGAGELGGVLREGAEAEVHEEDASALFAHDVFGFDIAMEEVGAVDGGEGSGDLEADEGGFVIAEGSLGDEEGGEGFAVDEVGPEADAPVVALAAVDGDDVGVLDAGEGAGFVEGGLELGFGVDGAGEEELDGDLALEVGIPCAVDLAEAPGSDAGEQVEGAPRWFRARRGRPDREGLHRIEGSGLRSWCAGRR